MRRLEITLDDIPEEWRSKVELCPDEGCWLWTGRLTQVSRGYAVCQMNGKTVHPHRYLWLKAHPDFYLEPRRLERTCRRTWCVNPAHWELA